MAKAPELDIVIVGARPHPVRDAYHSVLRATWRTTFAGLTAAYLGANLLFATAFWLLGGVANARPDSFRDAFFFSVQTMATIGYGGMVPQTDAANLLVVVESVFGMVFTALVTGVVFTRFSQTRAMVVFSDKACIAPMDGVPTLMIRVGNDRSSAIFDAAVRLVLTRTEKTKEGATFYRMLDLELVRERSPALGRSWTIMHRIVEKSPLYGLTPRALVTQEVELLLSLAGTDDTSLQPVHGRTRYDAPDVVWGARPADLISELADGRIQVDIRRFHDVVATKPTDDFPYPAKPA